MQSIKECFKPMWSSRSQKIKCSVLNSIILSSPLCLTNPNISITKNWKKKPAVPFPHDTNQNVVTTRLMVPPTNILTFWLCNISRIAVLLNTAAAKGFLFKLQPLYMQWMTCKKSAWMLLWSECLCSVGIHESTKMLILEGRVTGRCLGHEVGAQAHCSYKRGSRGFTSPYTTRWYKDRSAPRRGPALEQAGILISDLQAQNYEKLMSVVYKSPNPQDIVTAAQRN